MSTPRLCDDCNSIFSENEEGWSSAPVTINKRNERGVITPINVQLDYCPPCTDRKTGNNRGEPNVPPVKGRYNERYTRQLEREAGIAGRPHYQSAEHGSWTGEDEAPGDTQPKR